MAFESIHNYYETLVFHEIQQQVVTELGVTDQGLLEDIACLALNKLPSRYFRHGVDMAFYLGARERTEMEQATRDAVAASTRNLLDTARQPQTPTDESP